MIRPALAVLGLMCARGAVAQQSAAPDTAAARQPLFETNEPLALTFRADFGALGKQRGTKKDTLPGTLSLVGPAGDTVTFKVLVNTLGH